MNSKQSIFNPREMYRVYRIYNVDSIMFTFASVGGWHMSDSVARCLLFAKKLRATHRESSTFSQYHRRFYILNRKGVK